MRIDQLFEPYHHHHQAAARSALGLVIDVCHDGHLGYAKAGEVVADGRLKELFALFSAQRRDFAKKLEEHALWVGGIPEAGPRVGGLLHRKWIEIRGTIEHGAAVTLLSECERGENSALARYEHALSIPMPEDLRLILLAQVREIRAAHDQLDRMRGHF